MGACGSVTSSKKKKANNNNFLNNNDTSKNSINNNNINNITKLKKKKNQVIISVKYNDNDIIELYLDKKQKISDLINELKLDLEYDYDFYDSNEILINDKIHEELDKIFNIKKQILIIIKQFSLQLAKNNREYIYNNTSLIGTLAFNHLSLLGIFIYNINLKQIISYEYPFQDYYQLQFINKFTAFCNSKNSLYISGGENENDNDNDNEGSNNFIKIDLEQLKQNELLYNNLIQLNYKRYWHSMIFIPEKYIYIIGGPHIKETEIYDISKNEIKIDGKLNYERCEPSLILVNNKYLYCICGFCLNTNFVDTIEKCNLYKKERKWEIVNYHIKTNEENITERSLIVSFFGVSYINENIILIGDKENNNIINPNYLLKPNDIDIDIIEEYGFIESDNTRLFTEKFFIPFNNNESIAFIFKSGDPKILIVNNNDGNIKEIILKEKKEDSSVVDNNANNCN